MPVPAAGVAAEEGSLARAANRASPERAEECRFAEMALLAQR
jgi:hypothetical protein